MGFRRAGGEPGAGPGRLEHRHHHLRGPARGLDGSPGPAGRAAGTHQRLARVPGRADHARVCGRADRRHLDRRGSRRDRRSADPSAPAPDAVLSHALAPLRGCTQILRAVGAGITSTWTPGQADSWRLDAAALIDTIATARREHDRFRLSTRWNARARRQRPALGQAEEALRSGERIAICTRSMARALADGSGHAHPMPALGAMLASTASATAAYAAWLASHGESDPPGHRRAHRRAHLSGRRCAAAGPARRWAARPQGRARRAGISKAVGPRTLRHTFISTSLDAGVPLRDVQEAASHADPRTPMRCDRAPPPSTATPPPLSRPTSPEPPGRDTAELARIRLGESRPGGSPPISPTVTPEPHSNRLTYGWVRGPPVGYRRA